MNPAFDTTLLSRVEDASLNASAPPQQFWLDGWLVRTQPGHARRARCINAVASGRLPWPQRLQQAQALYRAAGLPVVVRITPFTQPEDLDQALAEQGWQRVSHTQVWVRLNTVSGPVFTAQDGKDPAAVGQGLAVAGLRCEALHAEAFAAAIGALRGTPPDQQRLHAQRLRLSPVPHRAVALRNRDGQLLACGQAAREARFVGLYDVHTQESARGQGLGRYLCEHLLSLAASEGADVAYLQVEADNLAAQALYRGLGFVPAYSYHYRLPPEA